MGATQEPLTQLINTLTLSAGYNTNLVITATTLFGLAAGIVGVFGLLRKRSLIADALGHSTLPGIGIAFLIATYLGIDSKNLPLLLTGATISGVLGVLCIQFLIRHTRLKEDASIGIVLSVFFGLGVIFLSIIQSLNTGNAAGLDRFIYGQAAAMNSTDAFLMGAVASVSALISLLLFKEFTLISFDQNFAEVTGWRVSIIDLLMLSLVVLVTVAGLQAVGLILVVAMLIIPAVSARFWSDRLKVILLLSAFFGAMSGYIGAVVSSLFPNKPTGAVIVLTAGMFFVFSMIVAPKRGVTADLLRRLRFSFMVEKENLLEFIFEIASSNSEYETKVPVHALTKILDQRGWKPHFLSGLLWYLKRVGYVRANSDDTLTLTNKGEAAGARIRRNHYLWEQYLLSYADQAPSTIDWSVDQVEHILTDELIQSLTKALLARGIVIPENLGERA